MKASVIPTSRTLTAPQLNAQLDMAKWLALLTMAVDHFGLILAPEYGIFRLVGRLSLPLFLFVIAVRLAQQPDRSEGYLLRLSLWAIISQIPYWLGFFYKLSPDDMFYQLNIMVTLGLGTALTVLVDWMSKKGAIGYLLGWPLAAGLLVAGLKCDYGPLAVVAIPALVWLARRSVVHAAIACGLFGAASIISIQWGQTELLGWALCTPIGSLVAYACLSTRAKPWRMPGLFFYAFYPVHIILLILLSGLLNTPQ